MERQNLHCDTPWREGRRERLEPRGREYRYAAQGNGGRYSSDEGSVTGLSEGAAFSCGRGPTGNGTERRRSKAVQDRQTGRLGSLQTSESEPRSGCRRWTIISKFEVNLTPNLYKLVNRMSSGVTFLRPVAACRHTESGWWDEAIGHPDGRRSNCPGSRPSSSGADFGTGVSTGFLRIRPGKSAIDAVRTARQRCRRDDWVLDLM